jgi:hypothetical protein
MTKTIFIDIDGTLIEQHENYMERIAEGMPFKVLPGTLEKFKEWDTKCYNIILVTARRESSRALTERTLEELGVFYDQLIMGIGVGPRVVINDLKPNHPETPTAVAINLKRNEGIGGVNV